MKPPVIEEGTIVVTFPRPDVVAEPHVSQTGFTVLSDSRTATDVVVGCSCGLSGRRGLLPGRIIIVLMDPLNHVDVTSLKAVLTWRDNGRRPESL